MSIKIFQCQLHVFYLGEIGKSYGILKIVLTENVINRGDFVLILDEKTKKNYCKFLVLSGKSIGKIGWEDKRWFEEGSPKYFKRIEDL